MDFSWDEDQLAFRQAVMDFAGAYLNDDTLAGDQGFSREVWRRCGEFGLLGLAVPEELGGQGADPLTVMLALEALGYACRDNGLVFSINAHLWSAAMTVARFGNDEQKAKYFPGLVDGSLLGVHAMTEPAAGSDAFSLTARADRRGDAFVLNGSKVFITNAPVADLFVVYASTSPRLKGFGLSAFLVERETPGLGVGQPFEKMGLRSAPNGEVFLEDCVVPAANLLGREDGAMAIFNHSIDWERACILASAIGTMQRQVETSVAYARQRLQYGRPISDFQAVSHRIVDMQTRLDSARFLLYRAGWAKEQKGGRPTPYESAMAKMAISEAWVQNSLDAIQIQGAYGYMTETGIEQDVRDAVAGRIYSGTTEVMKNIIAAELGM